MRQGEAERRKIGEAERRKVGKRVKWVRIG